MFITRKHVHRRTFLRGVGATVALPLLDAMVPAGTALARTAAAPVPRFCGIWHPHGASPGYWSPLQEGRDFDFSFITKPLEPFRDRTVLVSGLDCTAAYSTVEEPGGNHARGAVFLSGARPKRDAVTPHLAVTIDQTIANRWGRDTRCCRPCSSGSRIRAATAATATGATVAPTRTRSRGPRRPRLCRPR